MHQRPSPEPATTGLRPIDTGSQGHRWWPPILVGAIVIGVLATFIVQNFDQVELHVLVWDFEVRLSLALLIAGALGFVLGLLVMRILR